MPPTKKPTAKTPTAARKTKSKTPRKKSVIRKYQAIGRWEQIGWEELLGLKEGRVQRAVFHDNEISFDWAGAENDSKAVQSTHLSTKDGIHFRGTTYCLPGCGEDIADATAALYSNPERHLLYGQWVWRIEGTVESFIIEFYNEETVEI